MVGILQQVDPLTTYRNRYNQLKQSIEFTINDMQFVLIFYMFNLYRKNCLLTVDKFYQSINSTSAHVIFYDDMAQSFDQGVHNASQHPIVVIISSVKARSIEGSCQQITFLLCNKLTKHCDANVLGEPKLTNYPPTRFLINHYHDAVEDLRDALRSLICITQL